MIGRENEMSLEDALKAVLEGDASAMDVMSRVSQVDVRLAAENLDSPPILEKESVRRILRSVREDEPSRRAAQLWAEFVSFGVLAGGVEQDALEIVYAPTAEEAIAETLFRLREIDDPVIGRLTREDIGELLMMLQ